MDNTEQAAPFTDRLVQSANQIGLYPSDFIELLLAVFALIFLMATLTHLLMGRFYEDYDYSGYYWFLWPSHHIFAFFFGLLIIRGMLFEPYRIDADTLAPELRKGDHVLIKKFEYALSLPLAHDPIARLEGPKRGDIVIFKHPDMPREKSFFRIIGLPGEVIRYNRKSGEVFINGKLLPQLLSEKVSLDTPQGVSVKEEDLGERIIVVSKREKELSKLGAWLPDEGRKIPQGHYFGMFDKRDACCDSREIGVIEQNIIVGRAFAVFMNDSDGIDFEHNRILN